MSNCLDPDQDRHYVNSDLGLPADVDSSSRYL